jgi:phage-related protein
MAGAIARLSVRIGVDIDDFSQKMNLLQKKMSQLGKSLEETGRKWQDFGNGASQSMSTALTLGSSLVPVLGSLVVAAGGLGIAFGAAGAGAMAFASIAIPALNGVFEASKEIEKINEKIAKADTAKERAAALKELEAVYGRLTGKEREALKALQDFKSFWSGFVKSLQNPVLDMFIKGLATLKISLTALKPVFESAIAAFGDLFNSMNQAAKSPQMKAFIDWLAANVGPAIKSFGTAFLNVMKGILNLMMAFAPLSKDMQNGLVGLTQRFAEWTEGLSKSQGFKDFISYVQANGPKLITILGQVADIVVKLIQAMAPFGPIILDVVSAILQLINYLLGLHPAVGIVLVGGLQLFGLFRLLAGPIGSIIGLLPRLGSAFSNIGKVIGPLKTAFSTLGRWFTTFGQWIMRLGPILSNFASGALRLLMQGFMGIVRVFNILRVAFMSNPFLLIITAVVALVAVIIYNWDTIKVYLLATWNYIKAAAIAIWNGIKAFLVGLWNGIKATAIAVWNGIKAFLAGLWNGIKATASSVWAGLKSAISSAWNAIKSTTSSVWNGIKSTISNIWNGIKSSVSSSINNVKSTVSNIWNSIKSNTSQMWNSIKSAISNAISGAVSAVRSYTGAFLSAGKGLLDALVSGIKSGFSRAIGAVRNGLAQIRSYLPFSPAKKGPLSDLDKSGESFFPTFSVGMKKGLRPSMRTLEKGLSFMVPSVSSITETNTVTRGNQNTINVYANDAQLTEDGLRRMLRRMEVMGYL